MVTARDWPTLKCKLKLGGDSTMIPSGGSRIENEKPKTGIPSGGAPKLNERQDGTQRVGSVRLIMLDIHTYDLLYDSCCVVCDVVKV